MTLHHAARFVTPQRVWNDRTFQDRCLLLESLVHLISGVVAAQSGVIDCMTLLIVPQAGIFRHSDEIPFQSGLAGLLRLEGPRSNGPEEVCRNPALGAWLIAIDLMEDEDDEVSSCD